MRILIVDDEYPTRESVRRLLADSDGEHELAGEASDAWEAIAYCQAKPVDLVLLNTQMPGMTGIEAARRLARLERPPAVVLLSRSGELAPATREHRVAGCLSKPIRPDRLREMLQLAGGLTHPATPIGSDAPGSESDPPRRVSVSARYRGGIRTVAIADIIYMRADQKYVNVRHLGGELLVDDSLRIFEQEFPDLFLRIHRNALVARSRLRGLVRQSDGMHLVEVRDCEDRLLVSRRHLPDVRRWISEREEHPRADLAQPA